MSSERARNLIEEAQARKLTGAEFIEFLAQANNVPLEETAQWAADTNRLLSAALSNRDWELLASIRDRMIGRLPEAFVDAALTEEFNQLINQGWGFSSETE